VQAGWLNIQQNGELTSYKVQFTVNNSWLHFID